MSLVTIITLPTITMRNSAPLLYVVHTNVIRYMAYTTWYILSMHVSTYKKSSATVLNLSTEDTQTNRR